jgi:diguanylate cyclase (GGDEF)-like protein
MLNAQMPLLVQVAGILLSLSTFVFLYRRAKRGVFLDWARSWFCLLLGVVSGAVHSPGVATEFYCVSQFFLLLHAAFLLRGVLRYRRGESLRAGGLVVWVPAALVIALASTYLAPAPLVRAVAVSVILVVCYVWTAYEFARIPTRGVGRVLLAGTFVTWALARAVYVRVAIALNRPSELQSFFSTAALIDTVIVVAVGMGVAILTFEAAEESRVRLAENLVDVQGKLREVAIRDALTGLYNRYYFNDVIRREIDRVRRYKMPFGVLQVAADGFGDYGREHGIAQAGELLLFLGNYLRASVRESDMVFRWEADTFLVVLGNTNEPGAELKARELQERLAGVAGYERFGRFTISIGWAAYDGTGEFPAALQEAESRLEEGRTPGVTGTADSAIS